MSEFYPDMSDNESIENNIQNNIQNIDNISVNSDNISNENIDEYNDFVRYQENINDSWMNAPKMINFDFKCMPLIYYPEYDLLPDIEFSNKIIIPKTVLEKISKYEGIIYPLNFKINNSDILVTSYDFKDTEYVYIPEQLFANLNLNIDGFINLSLHNVNIPKGTNVKLKPHTSNFLEIVDHKTFLETILVSNFTTLTKNQTITVKYLDQIINIDIIECQPEDTISIVNTDLEVDFEQPYDYVEPPPKPIQPKPIEQPIVSNYKSGLNFKKKKDKEDDDDNRFPGVGRTLGNS